MSSNTSNIITSFPTILGGIIGDLRKKQGLSQGEFAERMGLGQSTWSRVEKGVSGLSIEQLVLASEVLEIRPSKLVAMAEKIADDLRTQNIKVENKRSEGASAASIVLGTAALGLLIAAVTRK